MLFTLKKKIYSSVLFFCFIFFDSESRHCLRNRQQELGTKTRPWVPTVLPAYVSHLQCLLAPEDP